MGHEALTLDRRGWLKAAGAAALGLATPAVVTSGAPLKSLTVADPGGPCGIGYRKAFYDPFEKLTGIRIVNVAREAEPTAQFKAIVETKAYTWDVCSLSLSAREILARENLLDPIGFTRDAAPGLMPEAISPIWMATDVYASVFAYRNAKFDASPPRSWADFWDVQRFPGRRSLRKNPMDTLEAALLADGVPLEKLYPLDVARAFKSLDRIKRHVAVWWSGGAQSTQLLYSGEVDLIAGWNARFQAAIDGGAPATIVWNQGLYSLLGWGIPRGSPRADLARRFVRFCADPERQAAYTDVLTYGPTNLDAYKSIPAERARLLPTSPENLTQMAIANEDWWSANRAAATERFNGWLLS